jgi:hypothetical protein
MSWDVAIAGSWEEVGGDGKKELEREKVKMKKQKCKDAKRREERSSVEKKASPNNPRRKSRLVFYFI